MSTCILLLLDGMLYQSIKSNMSFEVSVSLLIFCLDDLPGDVSGVSQSWISCLLSVSPLCLLVRTGCFEVLLCWVPIYLQLLHLLELILCSLCNVSLLLWPLFERLVYLIQVLLPQLSFDLHLHGIPFSILSLLVWVFRSEGRLL